MILYLDTSAFLKLYVAEPESPSMRAATTAAETTYTHLLAYAEMRAGFAKAVRERRITAAALPGLVAAAEAVWRALPEVDYRVAVFDAKLAGAAVGLGMAVLQ